VVAGDLEAQVEKRLRELIPDGLGELLLLVPVADEASERELLVLVIGSP
jgi:hypothetical protein